MRVDIPDNQRFLGLKRRNLFPAAVAKPCDIAPGAVLAALDTQAGQQIGIEQPALRTPGILLEQLPCRAVGERRIKIGEGGAAIVRDDGLSCVGGGRLRNDLPGLETCGVTSMRSFGRLGSTSNSRSPSVSSSRLA